MYISIKHFHVIGHTTFLTQFNACDMSQNISLVKFMLSIKGHIQMYGACSTIPYKRDI